MKKAAILIACLLYILFSLPTSLKSQTNPDLTFHSNRTMVGIGERLTLELETSGTAQEPVDLYIAVRLPDENFLFFTQNPFIPFVPTPTPYMQNFNVTANLILILNGIPTEGLEGEYVFIAAYVRAGRPANIFNVVGNIEQIQIRITSERAPGELNLEEISVSPDGLTLIDASQRSDLRGYSSRKIHWQEKPPEGAPLVEED